MKIANLRHHPAAIPEIARWHYAEWQALYPHKSLADFEHDLALALGHEALPQTWLLLEGERVCGTASLLRHDMSTNAELSPWLANIYICREDRGRGFGAQIVRRVMTEAAALGIHELYLFTADQRAFYERLGWTLLKIEPYEGTPVAIMSCSLTAGQE